jgi:hypothetical protein
MSSSSSPWRAVVSIRRIVDSEGKRLDRSTLSQFGSPIEDRTDVEGRIRQAQQALLNPDMPMEMFLSTRGMSKPSALRFTRNSIVVEIKGQGVDDLAFVDLPGGVHCRVGLSDCLQHSAQVSLPASGQMDVRVTLRMSKSS